MKWNGPQASVVPASCGKELRGGTRPVCKSGRASWGRGPPSSSLEEERGIKWRRERECEERPALRSERRWWLKGEKVRGFTTARPVERRLEAHLGGGRIEFVP